MKIPMLKFLLLAAFISCTTIVYAEEGDEEGAAEEAVAAAPEIGYYNITPDFATNIAVLNPREKMHYLRVKVSLMLGDSANDTPLVTEMTPLIKDAIVTILGNKDYATVSSASGREKIRTECRDKLISIMQEKVGRQVIDDVLFISYMYQ